MKIPREVIVADLDHLRADVDQAFRGAFGQTPLRERLQDVLEQALQLSRYYDLTALRAEAGDLLCAVLQLFNECGWDPADAIRATLAKVERRRQQYAGLGRKTTVAIFGGAFDPITLGHVGVAQFVLNCSRTFDEVWLMPCFQHMNGKSMTSPDHRLAMCRLAAQRDGRLRVFDYEIKHEFRGETYHFVKRLLAEDFARDQYDFSLIIGQDNANGFANWVNGLELERMIRFVVVPRRGVPFEPAATWYLKAPHLYLAADNPVMEISSTEVRRMLREGDERGQQFVDPRVLEYIQTNRLYCPQ